MDFPVANIAAPEKPPIPPKPPKDHCKIANDPPIPTTRQSDLPPMVTDRRFSIDRAQTRIPQPIS